jgi:arylsulfatase A-like enzyme
LEIQLSIFMLAVIAKMPDVRGTPFDLWMMRNSKTLLLGVSVLLVTVMGCGRQKPQNVILIVVDTLRADHLSLYGYDKPTSPQLQEWAATGLVFDRAFATSPWTLPTFGSVLTGLWPAQHSAGARLPVKTKAWRRAPLSEAVTTLPEVMQRRGFATAAIVNSAFLRKRFGAARGFEFYDYQKARQAEAVVDLAQTWLSENGQKRFFMMVHMIDPHLPYVPPEEFKGKFGDVPADAIEASGRKNVVSRLPELTEADRATLVARYDEEIAFVDQQLGRLFGFLEEQGLWKHTLIILTSDHGEELFDHGGFEHGHTMFQEVLGVPLVFWGPGIEAGRTDAPVSLVDLTPTIYEAMGVKVDDELSGVSLWEALLAGERPARREILAQNTLWSREHKAIISWPYKLILDPKSGHLQLYDLESDPLEKLDLAEDKLAVAQELERRLLGRLAGLQASPSDPAVLSEEIEEELRALGYLD